MKHAMTVLACLLALAPVSQSQDATSSFSKIDAFADLIELSPAGRPEKMTGNVVITLKYEEKDKEPMRIKGESATFKFKKDSRHFEKIVIEKNVVVLISGNQITADKLEWDMQSGIITLTGNVITPWDEQSKMVGEKLTINLKTGAKKLFKGGVIDWPVPDSQGITP